jgi:hypothetical protein
METLTATFKGIAPLLMHNVRLADPLNPYALALHELTSKRSKKTEDNHLEIRRAEWFGGMYDVEGKPVIPADMVLAATIEGARKKKNGKQVQQGVFEALPFFPLVYDGPKDITKLFNDSSGAYMDCRSVVVNRARVMRCRPRFNAWELPVALYYDETIIDREKLATALMDAGRLCGLGTYRPRYGRFEVEFK